MTSDTVDLRLAGNGAHHYVLSQLDLAVTESGSPLAGALRTRRLSDESWLFAAASQDLSAPDWEGGIPGGSHGSDAILAAAIAQWLSDPPAGACRALLFEDALALARDPAARHPLAMTYGLRVYWATSTDEASADIVTQVFRRVPGYPGIGVLATLPSAGLPTTIDDQSFRELVDAADVALVRACDDEVWLLSGIGAVSVPESLGR